MERKLTEGERRELEGATVMQLMELRRGEFHLQGHEVVLRFVEEVHDAD